MKKINKMNELNVVNSKITADLIKPEITGHATSNFETTFPIPKVGEVKMKIERDKYSNVINSRSRKNWMSWQKKEQTEP